MNLWVYTLPIINAVDIAIVILLTLSNEFT